MMISDQLLSIHGEKFKDFLAAQAGASPFFIFSFFGSPLGVVNEPTILSVNSNNS